MLRKSKKLMAIVMTIAIFSTMLSEFSVFAATTLTVGPASMGATYQTLTPALAAAGTGDTIFIYDGNYVLPHTVVTTNLTITGQTKDGVVLTPAADTAAYNSSNPSPNASWLAADTGGTLNVSNLTMNGSGKIIDIALFTKGALTVNNITIKNIYAATYEGSGISIFQPGSLVATNVTMSNIQRIGIHAKGSATVNGFTYTGKGPGAWLDYAMEAGTVATTTPFTVNVTNATITDCVGVAYDDSTSAGLYVDTYFYSYYHPTATGDLITANLSNINFNNCSTAFYAGYDVSLGELSNTTINNSNFINCTTDLQYAGQANTGTVTTNCNYYDGTPVVDFSAGTTLTVAKANTTNVPVDFTASSAVAKADTNVMVDVNIAANSASGTGTIVLPYDSSKLEFVSAAVGTALTGFVTIPPETSYMYSINTANNATTLAYVCDSVGGFTGAGSILRVTYHIKAGTPDGVILVTPSVTEFCDTAIPEHNLSYRITSGEIRVDNTAPIPATLTPSTTAQTNQNVGVTITYPGDAALKEYSYDNSIWSTYSAPLSIPANCTVYARSTDSAGNVSQVSSLVIANIDRVAPATPIIDVSTTSPTNQNVTVTITYTNTDNDISSREYSYDGIDWLPYTTTLSVGANCTVYAKSTDTASNFSTNQRNITNIDKVAPGVAILTASTTAPTNSLTVSIVYPTAFPGDSFLKQFSINGGSSWSTYGTAVPVSAAAVTVYAPINRTVSAQSQDEAGNWSAVTSLTLTNVVMLGDVNLGDNVSVVDALMSLHAASGKVPLTTANALYAADVNHSNTVTALDSLKILQFCSNKILGDYATVRPV
ncbi:MAG: hypothetical protein WCN92_03845 [Eubacteriales bacterium]